MNKEPSTENFDPVADPNVTLLPGQAGQLELNLELPAAIRKQEAAREITARVMNGEVVHPDEVSSAVHGAETTYYVRRALRGRMAAM